jgi:stage V sporulation protein AC
LKGFFAMQIEKNSDFKALKKRHAPSSPLIKNLVLAFLSGGFICGVGQGLFFLFTSLNADEKTAYSLVSLSFIFLSSLLTALGVFDCIARHTGAGTLLPVTGFANSVTSSAIDARSEGLISGVGVKIFSVAGPVILYATVFGTLYGIIYFLLGL